MDLNEQLSPIEQCFPHELVVAFIQPHTEQASELRFYQRFSRDKMNEKLRIGLFDRVLSELRVELRHALCDHQDRVQTTIQSIVTGKRETSIQ